MASSGKSQPPMQIRVLIVQLTDLSPVCATESLWTATLGQLVTPDAIVSLVTSPVSFPPLLPRPGRRRKHMSAPTLLPMQMPTPTRVSRRLPRLLIPHSVSRHLSRAHSSSSSSQSSFVASLSDSSFPTLPTPSPFPHSLHLPSPQSATSIPRPRREFHTPSFLSPCSC